MKRTGLITNFMQNEENGFYRTKKSVSEAGESMSGALPSTLLHSVDSCTSEIVTSRDLGQAQWYGQRAWTEQGAHISMPSGQNCECGLSHEKQSRKQSGIACICR